MAEVKKPAAKKSSEHPISKALRLFDEAEAAMREAMTIVNEHTHLQVDQDEDPFTEDADIARSALYEALGRQTHEARKR